MRTLTRSPGFSILAILTLALGIAAGGALFSVANSVLWRPLPFPDSERLVKISERNLNHPGGGNGVAAANFRDWRERTRSLAGVAAFSWPRGENLTGAGFAERIRVAGLSDRYFEVLGVTPAVGRTFDKNEGRSIILSDAFRRRVFHDAAAMGSTVKLAGEPYTIVGVLPAGFRHEIVEDADAYVPLDLGGQDRGMKSLGVMGRLAPGVTIDQAAAELRGISADLARRFPQTDGNWTASVENLRVSYSKFNRGPMRLFLGFGACVFFIACANVAGLLLVRAVARQREFAIRVALGARRAALLRMALAESAWIALPGGIGGAILAAWGVAAIREWIPHGMLTREEHISMDLTTVAWVLGASLAATLVFGLVLAAMAVRIDPETALRDGARAVSGGRRVRRAVDVCCAAEVALSMVLLFGAGLFVNSYLHLEQVDLGFDPHGVITMRMAPGRGFNAEARRAFYRSAVAAVRGIPGVRDAALGNGLPLDYPSGVSLSTPERPHPARGEEHSSLARVVSPEWFGLLGTALVEGRAFTNGDSETAPRVAIVNQNLAREMFGDRSPVGQDLLVLEGSPAATAGAVRIVGVARNVRELSQNEVPFGDMYLPFAQNPPESMYLMAKVNAGSEKLAPVLRRTVQSLDAEQAVFNLKTLDEQVHESLRGARFNLWLVGVFAGLAVMLAAVGVYGAISFAVSQRRREIGLRMALGAQPRAILQQTLASTAKITLYGIVAGAAIASVLGQMMKSALYLAPHEHSGLIYGVSIHDPLSLAAAILGVLVLAAIAGLAPASRAARVDPVTALR